MLDAMTPDTGLALMRQAESQAAVAAKRAGETAAAKADPLKYGKSMAAIEKAAEDFEAVFVAEMLKPMFKGLSVDPMFGGGKGEEVFSGMMVQEYGKIIADRGGIGIADQVKAEMIRIQEETQNDR